jgi:hypothetical protein
MGRHVIRSFVGMRVVRLVLRGQSIEVRLHVDPDFRVDIFIYGQRRRRVLDEDMGQSDADSAQIRYLSQDLARHYMESPRPGPQDYFVLLPTHLYLSFPGIDPTWLRRLYLSDRMHRIRIASNRATRRCESVREIVHKTLDNGLRILEDGNVSLHSIALNKLHETGNLHSFLINLPFAPPFVVDRLAVDRFQIIIRLISGKGEPVFGQPGIQLSRRRHAGNWRAFSLKRQTAMIVGCLILLAFVAGSTPSAGTIDLAEPQADPNPPLWDWTWEKVNVPRPSARSDFALAYDEERKVTVLFGGDDNCAMKGDTWEWDGMAWKEQNLSGGGPSPRHGHRMVYHPGKKMVLLFGGVNQCVGAITYFSDLWGWDGQKWHELSTPSDTINGRSGPVMVWDGDHDRVILYGGTAGTSTLQDTWFWDNGWTFYNLPAGSKPPIALGDASGAYRLGSGLYLISNKMFYVFHTSDPDLKTHSWTDHTGATDPPISHSSAMVSIPDVNMSTTDDDVILLYGGATDLSDSNFSDESWIWWFDTWQSKWSAYKMANTPPPRHSHAMVYDKAREEVLLFGGETSSGDVNDFWILHRPGRRYVATTGADADKCTDSSRPCKTINYTVMHSPPGGEILMRDGDYDTINQGITQEAETVLVRKDISIYGGYSSNRFVEHERTGTSRIVGFESGFIDSGPRAVTVGKGATVLLDAIDIWWGTHKVGGGIYNDGNLTIRNSTITYGAASLAGGCIFGTPNSRLSLKKVTVSDCYTYGDSTGHGNGAGIYSNGALSLHETFVKRNTAKLNGGGIYQYGGPLDLTNSTISDNEAVNGGGLYTDYLDNSGQFQLQNVEVLYNLASQQGGGVYFNMGQGVAKNLSVLRNRADRGGGIHQGSAIVKWEHSLVAANKATAAGPDCSGTIPSQGYNLVGIVDSACSITTEPGDKLGSAQNPIDPKVDATGMPLLGSMAKDGGSPIGSCAPVDRLDVDRSKHLPCDIGAYESTVVAGKTKPQLPANTRYVSELGDDANDCLSPQTACATLPHAMQGASYNGTIAVAGGTFKPGDSETWYVDQSVRFSGGWSDDFSQQNGWTTIDGEGSHPGLTVARYGAATFENFAVQNGSGYFGGGVFNEGALTLVRSMVVDNHAQRGGGVFSRGELQLISSLVARNQAVELGGALYQQDGTVHLDHLTMTANQLATVTDAGAHAADVGGIVKEAGELHVQNSILAANPTVADDSTCAHGNPFDTLEYSLIMDPRCGTDGEDGNILGDPVFVDPDDGNYHLSASSPAIDQGQPDAMPTADFDSDWRPCHAVSGGQGRVDMGFDEYSDEYVCYGSTLSIFLPMIQ